jgi:hypothetical protein
MQTFHQRLAEELEAGQARVIMCRPVRIFEREEFEDEGSFWIFDGGEGVYLAMCGQDYERTSRFPSSYFEVVLGVRHGTVITIKSHDSHMPSTIVVSGEQVTWRTFPERDVTVFSAGRGSDLLEILEKLGAASAGETRVS